MTMTNIEKAIIRAIIMAQISSDAGKGIHRIYIPGGNFPAIKKYRAKEFYELRALKMITASHRCGINFWCEFAPDQNGIDSVLVYFDIKVDGKRFQISFHNPRIELFSEFVNRGRKTRWTADLSGSARSCQELARLITE